VILENSLRERRMGLGMSDPAALALQLAGFSISIGHGDDGRGRPWVTGDEVRAAVFPYRFNGYSPNHVDLFLLRVADLLDDGQITDGDFLHDRFPRVMRGYDGAVVDQFISSLARGGLVVSQRPTAARGSKRRRSREPVPAKLKKANAGSQVYYHFSRERSDASFREQYRRECEVSWAQFFVVPGTRLTLTGSEISGMTGLHL